MFAKLKYEIIKRDIKTPAKIVNFENPILNKKKEFPGVIFDIRQREDFDCIIRRFGEGYNSKKICGFQIPYYMLARYAPNLINKIPSNMLLISDINNEVFFYSSIKDEKKNFYFAYKLIPDKIKKEMLRIQKIKSFSQKILAHKVLWQNITNDKKLLLDILTAYINTQMSYGIDFISVPSPMLYDKDDLVYVESCYNKAMELYHGDLLDIEQEQGRVLSLFITLHKSFLKDSNNIKELFLTIERIKPKTVILKLLGVDDIREHLDVKKNWKFLMKNLGILSDDLRFPIIYLSTSTEGLIAQTYGIDCFTQMFNKKDNLEKDFRGGDAETSSRLWLQNPKLSSGKIISYDEKDYINRTDLEKEIGQKGVLPYPCPELSSMNPQMVIGMNPNTFREFAKYVLMVVRDFEVNENTDAINKKDISTLKNRFGKWVTDLGLFPS